MDIFEVELEYNHLSPLILLSYGQVICTQNRYELKWVKDVLKKIELKTNNYLRPVEYSQSFLLPYHPTMEGLIPFCRFS